MIAIVQRYLEYRRVGFGRVAAFRFAMLVGGGSLNIAPRQITPPPGPASA